MARSDNWRVQKSGVMAIEGAMILKALQKVAGAAGLPKGFQVKFAAKSEMSSINFDKKSVTIGAGRLFKEAPIPSDSFDVLVGLTLHEVGHKMIDTELVERRLQLNSRIYNDKEKDLLQKFANIGEDIAIESRTRSNPNLAEYDEAMHKWGVSQMRNADPYKLLEVWIEYALGHKSDAIMNLPEQLTEPMQQLVALTGWLRKGNHTALDRAAAYFSYWDHVKEAILNPPKPPKPEPPPTESEHGDGGKPEQKDGEPESEKPDSKPPEPEPEPEMEKTDGDTEPDDSAQESDEVTGETSSVEDDGESENGEEEEVELERPLAPRPGDALDAELIEAINTAIEDELEDVTEQVATEFEEQMEGREQRLRSVIRSRETRTPLIKPDAQLRKRLERIMTIRKRLQTRTMHGEQYGRIDKRHLHRIATDKRIFSLRYKFPDGFPNTKILIDLSSSMSGQEADEVLEAAGALQTLVNAEVWCYNDSMGKVNLVRMDEGKLIHTFKPVGSTPSGLAIVGVALGMKKGGLVIHLTDGCHNSGQSPWTAHWILKKKGITLVNLIWGKETIHYKFEEMNRQLINGIAEFPDALYKILIEQTKLSKIGGK